MEMKRLTWTEKLLKLLQEYFNHKPKRREQTETDIIRGAARAIKGIPKCFFATLILYLAVIYECAYNAILRACAWFSHPLLLGSDEMV